MTAIRNTIRTIVGLATIVPLLGVALISGGTFISKTIPPMVASYETHVAKTKPTQKVTNGERDAFREANYRTLCSTYADASFLVKASYKELAWCENYVDRM